MARFPSLIHPRNPQVGTGGYVAPGSPITPVPAPAAVGPRTVSFTAPAAPMPTLAALQQREQEIQTPQLGNITAPSQGWAYLANSLVSGLEKGMLQRQEAKGRQELAQALTTGLDPNTGQLSQAALGTVMARDPEMGMQFIADAIRSRREQVQTVTGDQAKAMGLDPTRTWQVDRTGKANDITVKPTETYGPVITGDDAKAAGLDPAKSYQKGSDGQWHQVGGSGTNVTINPPSAETGAKLGLAQGFTDNYDTILKSVDAGEMTGPGYIKGVTLGYGNGGVQYRNLLQGTEALVRLLTGAGMNEAEARQRVTQYEPAATDDAPTLRSKVQGLKQALDNVKQGILTRGQSQPGATEPAPAASPPAATEPPATEPAPEASSVDVNDPVYQAAKKHYLEGGGTDAGWDYLTKNGRWKTFIPGGSNASNP